MKKQKQGAVLIAQWGHEIRSYVYSGFVEKLAARMPVTIVSRIIDNEFVDHVPDGVGVVKTPSFEVRSSFGRLHSLANRAHGQWRAERGESVSHEVYAFERKPGSFLGRLKYAFSPLLANRTCLGLLDLGQSFLARQAVARARPVAELFERLQPSVVMSPDYLSVNTIVVVLLAQRMGIKTIALPQNWNNIYKVARVYWMCDRQLVWSERMRDFVVAHNTRLEARRVIPVGSPQFDFHADKALIMSRDEFARIIGFDPDRPVICYSAASPKTALQEACILRGFLEATRAKPLFGKPQVVIRLNPIGSDPEFLDLAREYPDCYLCEPGWDVRRDIAWTCSSFKDVGVWLNLIYHSALNISVPSTVTLDFTGMDRPVVNVGYDPPGTDRPLVSFSDLWKQDIYRPIVQGKVVEIASSPEELTDLVECFLRDPSRGRENRKSFIADEFAGCFGKSGDRILSEVHEVLQEG